MIESFHFKNLLIINKWFAINYILIIIFREKNSLRGNIIKYQYLRLKIINTIAL